MLAQPLDNKKIRDMDLAEAEKEKVAYAGEIVVNLSKCTYDVNANSGTYQPISPVPLAVLEHFDRKVEVKPSNLSETLRQPANTPYQIPGCRPR